MAEKTNLNKLIISVILISVLIFVSGIQGCNGNGKEKVIPGISMQFVTDAPPATITTEQKVPIYADIKNGGGVHVGLGEAVFSLSGVGDNLDGVTEKLSNSKFLDKTTGIERLKFATAAGTNLALEKAYMFPLTLTGCYNYETVVQVQACIAEEGSDICSIAGEKITKTSNSDSPVKVISFTEKVEGNKLIITFEIENKGVVEGKPGEVYLKDANCDLIFEKDINEVLKRNNMGVEITAGKGTDEFICDLQDDATSISQANKGKVTCTKKLEGGDYLTPFRINLRYKYVDSIAAAITLIPE